MRLFSVVSGLGWPSANEQKDSEASGVDDQESSGESPDNRRSTQGPAGPGGPGRVVAGLGWPIG
jgi:hypothetical protein